MDFDVLISWKVGEERMEQLESNNIESTATLLFVIQKQNPRAEGSTIYTDVHINKVKKKKKKRHYSYLRVKCGYSSN